MKVLDILDYGNNGEGIAKDNGKVYFVPKTIVGEKVKAVIIKDKSNFCNCRLSKIVNASRSRILPKCKYFDKCGGCQLQHLDYKSQLEIKKKTTQNTINKISRLNIEIDDILLSDKSFGYRNKMVFAIDEKGKLCMHDDNGNLFEVDYCHLANDGINKILSIVNKFIKTTNQKGYDKLANKGLLKYLVVRQLNNQFLITMVVTQKGVPQINILQKMLDSEQITYGLFVNVNNDKSSLILTDKFIHIAGLKTLTGEYICKNGKIIKYPISPLSFMQVNNYIKEKIYAMVEEVLHGEKLIIDAYSGAGLLTAILSQISDHVVGIEMVKAATQDADKLAHDNNITNMTNINADCMVGIDKALNLAQGADFAIVLDPPRKGADQSVLMKILKAEPNKIVYISCNPATLARDLKILSDKYVVDNVLPCDMFPNTAEVETFVVMTRKIN